MLSVITSVSTFPPARVWIGPVMLRSIVSVPTIPSIHSRVGTKSRPSAATAKIVGGDEAYGVALAAPPGSGAQQVIATQSKSPRRTTSPPLLKSPSRTRQLPFAPEIIHPVDEPVGASGSRPTG